MFYTCSTLNNLATSQWSDIQPQFVPWLEIFIDALFKGYVRNLIQTGELEKLKNRWILEYNDMLGSLCYIEKLLIRVSKGEVKGVTLAKPYVTLRDRLKPENLDSLIIELSQ